jgi:hypothetical protein
MDYRSDERRAEKRIPYITEAMLEGTRSLSNRISDLSASGAFIETINAALVGSVFGLHFNVRGSQIRVTAEVRYSMPQIGMGVRFLDLNHEDRALIERLVLEQSK